MYFYNIFPYIFRRFICCTVESDLNCPTLVMRNMRQVMTGLTNYLLVTGEGDLANIVKMAAKQEPSLRLETVFEDLMQEMVVKPLSKHLHCLILQQYPQQSLKPAGQDDKVMYMLCNHVSICIHLFIGSLSTCDGNQDQAGGSVQCPGQAEAAD